MSDGVVSEGIGKAVSRRDIEERTRQLALRVIKLVDSLPPTTAGREVGRQLLRSATSTAANYRAAGHGKSKQDFTAKLAIAAEEADETEFWLSIVVDAGLLAESRVSSVVREAAELSSILSASLKTARGSNAR